MPTLICLALIIGLAGNLRCAVGEVPGYRATEPTTDEDEYPKEHIHAMQPKQ